MLVYEIEFGSPEFDDALRIRTEVLRKPLGMEYTAEQIAAEYDSVHLAIYQDNGVLAGYLNLVPLPDGALKMRQVAIDPNLQHSGFGRRLVVASEQWAAEHGYTKMVLHAREVAVPFYLKLDYQVEGERFQEVGIPHFKMWKQIETHSAL